MGKSNLNVLQSELLKMMDIVHKVLIDNKLNYFVSDGTLLGAVRHKGFIPWDDDIDISMTRENYNKLLKISDKILPDDLVFITIDKDDKFPFMFGKIYNKNTTLLEANNKTYHGGIYIDVFPIDNISNNKNHQKRAYSKILKYKRMMRLKNNYYYGSRSRIFILKILSIPIKLFYSNRKINESVMGIIEKYKGDDSYMCINYFGAYGTRQIYNTKWITDTKETVFSGIKINTINKAETILEMTYGNYMDLPPIEKRVAHHWIFFLDLHKPFKND